MDLERLFSLAEKLSQPTQQYEINNKKDTNNSTLP
jgi:hypothetical protein